MTGVKNAGRFLIERAKSAATILDLALSMGLHDVQKWVKVDDTQQLIDKEKWIAFIASDSDSEAGSSKPCGVVSAGIEEEGRLWIELIAVDEQYRRQGIATDMIDSLTIWGKVNDHRALFVDVDDDNYPAIELYKSAGFRKAGKIDEYYYDSSTALVFVRKI